MLNLRIQVTRLPLSHTIEAHKQQELLQRQASAGGMKVRREGNEMEWEARKKSGFKGMTVRLEEKI